MSDWSPALYTRFEDERTRPAVDLLARVPVTCGAGAERAIFDLGCGPGNSTELLMARWGAAAVTGVDSSPAMVDAARARLPGLTVELGDIAQWSAPRPARLLFANASLHWVPAHEQLLPRLLGMLAPGGVLAAQMPDNLEEPSHRAMRETAAEPAYAAAAAAATAARTPLLDAGRYHDLLAPLADIDIWRTTYHHALADPAAIVEWLRGSGLRPYLDALEPPLRGRFLADYEARIDAAYPARSDGRRLLAFPRLFIVARPLHPPKSS